MPDTANGTGTEADATLLAMAAADAAWERYALEAADGAEGPFLTQVGIDGAVGSMLVVPERAEPYDLAEIAELVPSAFERSPHGSLLLERPLVIAPGAGRVLPRVRLARRDLRGGVDGIRRPHGHRWRQ